MSNKDKIKHILRHFGLNPTQLSNSLGYKGANKIYDILRERTRGISEDLANRILSNYPEISKAWLLADEGEMLVGTNPTDLAIPLINIDSVGGLKSQNSLTDLSNTIERMIPMADSIKGDIAIHHTGYSMAPTIPAGSILHLRQVDNWQEYFGYGGIFVLELTDGRRVTKQVSRSKIDAKEYVLCVSFNPDFDEEELPRSMISRVWRVLHCVTTL